MSRLCGPRQSFCRDSNPGEGGEKSTRGLSSRLAVGRRAVGRTWEGLVVRGRMIRLVGMPRSEDGGDSAHGKEKKEKRAERELERSEV